MRHLAGRLMISPWHHHRHWPEVVSHLITIEKWTACHSSCCRQCCHAAPTPQQELPAAACTHQLPAVNKHPSYPGMAALWMLTWTS